MPSLEAKPFINSCETRFGAEEGRKETYAQRERTRKIVKALTSGSDVPCNYCSVLISADISALCNSFFNFLEARDLRIKKG
jgi:hypothetical protein